ncbi:acyl-CoA dehydrogenase family protein [Candidatus Cyanaurora vandensis]|uniref:acyl-CoA dehydrogenase family protein n=1 Tax=Candidatus Cyanaurora vandensis TaxID=2714958 RepID=UPI00257DB2FF|nr:acyl-CoA dehydrogenase family protein [Candidatus Cyanaurora vandensis]
MFSFTFSPAIRDFDQVTAAHSVALTQAQQIADFCALNAAQLDQTGDFPVVEFRMLAEAGLLAAPLSQDWGGLGLGSGADGLLTLLELLCHLGRGNLSVGRVYEGHVNALLLIQTFGTLEQQLRYSRLVHEQHLFGVWNTEDADGVKLIPLPNGRYRLLGAKTFASGAGQVTRPLINGALPDGGWQMCVVPLDEVQARIDPSWWQPLGMRASTSYRIDFSGIELESEDLIGAPGDYWRQPWLTGGVVRFAAVQLGGAEALFAAVRTHLQERGWTEDPYQCTRVGQMGIALASCRLWLAGCAQFLQTPTQTATLVAYANMVRTAVESHCLEVLTLAERAVGARGLLKPHPLERIGRDLTLYLRQPAPDAALAQVGHHLLSQTTPIYAQWDHV